MKQITENYCNKDISVMLKEKGFDVPVENYFSLNKDAMLHNHDKKYGAKKNWNAFEICISRPSQSLALKWLREVHRKHICVRMRDFPTQYEIEVYDTKTGYLCHADFEHSFNSYVEACEAAIKYCLENLI